MGSSDDDSSVDASVDDGSASGVASADGSPVGTPIYQSTRYATHGLSYGWYNHGIGRLICEVQWISKTKEEYLTLPEALMEFMHKKFGREVHFCTEYRREEYTFRCHPAYQSNYPMYDWMIVRFDTGLFPCRLALVIILDNAPNDPYRLIVQCTTEPTGWGSVLLTEWFMSDTYYVISPESIEAPCFVIEHTDNNSKVHVVLSREKWAGQFTDMPGPDGDGYNNH